LPDKPGPDKEINMSTGKKILLVSKNTHFVNTVGRNLSKFNYRVKGTRAGNEELLDVMNTLIPDLTIMDAPLVSIDGIRQLIGIRAVLDTPIMMLSTQDSQADTVRTLSLGTCSHPFIKPMTFEQLVEQVNKMLDKN
jgi:DNA-binding response OmpR family regulator